mmetsp:Transcript_7516/g.30452  ORF Transcript_7516/g.30452 Transcript_7516/m.30452 type:complete len:228 (+) Transcript_7516:734-1417(+)
MMPCRSPLGASGRSSGLSRYDSKPNLSTSPVMISRPSLDEGRPGSLLCLGKRGKATARRGGGQRLLRMTREGRARVEKPTAQLFGRWRAGAGEIWALHRGGLGDALGEDLALDVHLGGHGDPVGVRQHGMLRPEGIGGTVVLDELHRVLAQMRHRCLGARKTVPHDVVRLPHHGHLVRGHHRPRSHPSPPVHCVHLCTAALRLRSSRLSFARTTSARREPCASFLDR